MAQISPDSTNKVAGLVLAAGRSVRFGGEKAAAQLLGRSLLEWAAQRLSTVCANVAINVRAGTEAEAVAKALGFPTVYDVTGDARGPLAGVKAGLIWAQAQGASALAVSPCDVPGLPHDVYVRLRECAEGGAAMAETSSGLQPLCSLWPVAALPAVRAALAAGAHPPTWEVLERLGARRVLFEPPEAFANINTREDLSAAEARHDGSRSSKRES
jgi:molybdopterin-guanine dinucleotide biosynthesis protein A